MSSFAFRDPPPGVPPIHERLEEVLRAVRAGRVEPGTWLTDHPEFRPRPAPPPPDRPSLLHWAWLLVPALIITLTSMMWTFIFVERGAQQGRQKPLAVRLVEEQAKQAELEAALRQGRAAHHQDRLRLAVLQLHQGDTEEARQTLDACPEDLRDWVWHRLRALADP